MKAPAPLLCVTRSRDGVWSVNERGPGRVAIAYFPTEWGAIRHAVRVARAYAGISSRATRNALLVLIEALRDK